MGVAHTHFSEEKITEFYRGFKQDCPEGKLTPAAFLSIYSKCLPKLNAKKFCEHIFGTFDVDNNGLIDFKEFLLAIDVTSSGSPEKKLSWAFRTSDSVPGEESEGDIQEDGQKFRWKSDEGRICTDMFS